MKAHLFWNNLKIIPRPWWALWAFGMALLGWMWLRYPTADITAYIEDRIDLFRGPTGLLPIPLILVRGATEWAPGAAIASLACVIAAGEHPKQITTYMACAVGILLIYFAWTAGSLGLASWYLLHAVSPPHSGA